MRGPLQIFMGENINVVGAKHSGRYLLLKILTLIPECFAQIFRGDRHNLTPMPGQSISVNKLSVKTQDLLRKCAGSYRRLCHKGISQDEDGRSLSFKDRTK
ncbi:hypothetical protein AM228_26765 [Planktothricoides sp. SR001]|nr:hypothetical protein AM228_26765 [Planktothricoides sp. SR001]